MTEFIDLLIRWAVGLVCLGVMAACCCRAGMLTKSEHKASWRAMFVFMGCFAFGTALDMVYQAALTFPTVFALAGISLYLFISKDTWNGTVPERARKDYQP